VPRHYQRQISYREFVARVRRHRPSDLLPALARAALQIDSLSSPSEIRDGVFPWSLGVAAKESLTAGTEFRRPGVTQDDVREICAAYNAIRDPLVGAEQEFVSQPHSFFTRMSAEQFPFQISHFEEISRLGAMFGDLDATLGMEVLSSDLIESVLGATVEEYIGAGFVFGVGAQKNQGFFDLELAGATKPRSDYYAAFVEVTQRCISPSLQYQPPRFQDARWGTPIVIRRAEKVRVQPSGRLSVC